MTLVPVLAVRRITELDRSFPTTQLRGSERPYSSFYPQYNTWISPSRGVDRAAAMGSALPRLGGGKQRRQAKGYQARALRAGANLTLSWVIGAQQVRGWLKLEASIVRRSVTNEVAKIRTVQRQVLQTQHQRIIAQFRTWNSQPPSCVVGTLEWRCIQTVS